jgi:hypothetical protein
MLASIMPFAENASRAKTVSIRIEKISAFSVASAVKSVQVKT